jgi:heavy metal translocating P-type ATPase
LSEINCVAVEAALSASPLVHECRVYGRTGSVALAYQRTAQQDWQADEARVLGLLSELRPSDLDEYRVPREVALALRSKSMFESVVASTAVHIFTRYFLPAPLRMAWTIWQAAGFVYKGLKSLLRLRLDVPVLDGAAMTSCLLKGDFSTAGSAMYMLRVSELLEEQTRKRSEQILISSLLKVSEKVWLVKDGCQTALGDGTAAGDGSPSSANAATGGQTTANAATGGLAVDDDREVLVEADSLVEGDTIILRTGQSLPVDGVVVQGEAWVNQAALTGESAAVLRTKGDDVFAGTALEDGEIYIRVKAGPEQTRLRSIVDLVHQAEGYKSSNQVLMERLADAIVPLNLLYAAAVFAATRSLEKLTAALMVDYSCALRLTGSIAALSAMREAALHGLRVKGSKTFEAVVAADAIVFDKTGTLTEATPAVHSVVALADWDEAEVLRLAACLEEHFPHPVARAIVAKARELGINHRERHAQVEYLVAHGIASTLDGKRVVIGSGHFVFDDEGVDDSAVRKGLPKKTPPDVSPLYLAVDGHLVGAILIRDPLKSGIGEAIAHLRAGGFKRIVMLTGDNQATAAYVAQELGISEFVANMLPEDKHDYLQKLKSEGLTVMMVGDGINDSPALSAADVGVAMGKGAALAREVADITLATDDLMALLLLRRLSQRMMRRTRSTYAVSIAVNTALLLLGTIGIVTPSISAFLHNATTVALSANGLRGYC